MSGESASRSERPQTTMDAAEVERRQQLAVEIVADGLLTLLLRERLAALDAEDRDARLREEAHAQTSAMSVPVAGARGKSVVSTTGDQTPAKR